MKSVLTAQVENVLKFHPHTRNSDIALTIEVWKAGYGHLITMAGVNGDAGFVALKALYELPREDNIKRIRAKFNAQGLYWPTDLKIARARGIQEDKWRVFIGYPEVAATQAPTRAESYTQQPAIAMSSRPDPRQDELFPH